MEIKDKTIKIKKWIFYAASSFNLSWNTKNDRNETRFKGAYSRDNLQKIKDGAYIINLDEYSDIGTHWVALYVQNNAVTYFDSLGVEHIPTEIITFIGNKNVKKNIFRIQTYDSIMYGYFSIGFIDLCFQ